MYQSPTTNMLVGKSTLDSLRPCFINFKVGFPAGLKFEMCENETCQYGATCQEDKSENGLTQMKCSCLRTCSEDNQDISGLVCGSDGNTYQSECDLLRHSCQSQKYIFITAHTSCTGKLLICCSAHLEYHVQRNEQIDSNFS